MEKEPLLLEYELKWGYNKPNKRTFIPENGHIYGRFTVIDNRFHRGKHSNHNWIKVKCRCGFEAFERLDQLNKGIRQGCFECSHLYKDRHFKQIGQLSSRMFSNVKRNARIRNIEFGITMQDMWDLFLRQEGKCALTGIALELKPIFYNQGKYPVKKTVTSSEVTASLDRINPEQGYSVSNIQWVHKGVNIMKNCLTNSEFINLCNLISKAHPNYQDDFEPTQLTGYLRRYIFKKSTRII